MKKNGFAPLIIILLIAILGVVLYIGYKSTPKSNIVTTSSTTVSPKVVLAIPPASTNFTYGNCVASPDGLQTACIKTSNNSPLDTLILNGKEGQSYDSINELQFSPDSKTVVYIATKNKESFAVINGNQQRPYDFVSHIIFSPNGSHYAYCAGIGGYNTSSSDVFQVPGYKTAMMIEDGVESMRFNNTGILDSSDWRCKPVFSPDSSQLVYSMVDSGKNLLVLNGKEIFSSTENSVGLPIFSGDSKKVYFVPFQRNSWSDFGKPILIDLSGNVIKTLDKVAYADPWELALNNDATKLLYEVQTSENNVNSYLYVNDSKIDTKEIDYATISPDGSKVAYIYMSSGTTVDIKDSSSSPTAHVVVNNKEIENYKTFVTRTSPITFTADSKDAIYISGTIADKLNYDPNKSKVVVVGSQKVCSIPFVGVPFGNTEQEIKGSTGPELASPTINGDIVSFIYFQDHNLMRLSGKINIDSCSLVN